MMLKLGTGCWSYSRVMQWSCKDLLDEAYRKQLGEVKVDRYKRQATDNVYMELLEYKKAKKKLTITVLR